MTKIGTFLLVLGLQVIFTAGHEGTTRKLAAWGSMRNAWNNIQEAIGSSKRIKRSPSIFDYYKDKLSSKKDRIKNGLKDLIGNVRLQLEETIPVVDPFGFGYGNPTTAASVANGPGTPTTTASVESELIVEENVGGVEGVINSANVRRCRRGYVFNRRRGRCVRARG